MVTKRKKKQTKEQKDQIAQKKEIRSILARMGFHRIPGVEGKHFEYDSRKSELDDIFILENVFLIVEYTVGENYKEHLAKKSIIYGKIMNDTADFINFLLKDSRFEGLRMYYEQDIKPCYPNLSQIQVRILYCSKVDVAQEYRDSINQIKYFDLYVLHYFKYLSAALKMSAINEMLDFLDIKQTDYGESITSHQTYSAKFEAYILPEVKSYFKNGYKIVTFYMDPQSILKRAYVLRHEGWREKSTAIIDLVGCFVSCLRCPRQQPL